MKQNAYIYVLVVFISMLGGGCKEMYYPDIAPVGKGVAVDGLITTGKGPHHIWLSYTSDFYSGKIAPPLEGATVYVEDELGNMYPFLEKRPGYYESSAYMATRVGGTYTLQFTTNDGHKYRSSPQTMTSPFEIDHMQGQHSLRTSSYESNSGNLIIVETAGVDALLVLKNHKNNAANVRFESDVKIQYIFETMRAGAPAKAYCWKYLRRFEGIDNFNLPTTSNQPGDVSHNVVAFLPYANKEYLLRESDFLHTLLVEVRLYSINNEAYAYYHDIHKQITSDGTIFSPVPSQMTSNIYCETDPNRIAVGFFEASAVSRQAFILRLPPQVDTPSFEPTEKYDAIPLSAACQIDELPSFWIN